MQDPSLLPQPLPAPTPCCLQASTARSTGSRRLGLSADPFAPCAVAGPSLPLPLPARSRSRPGRAATAPRDAPAPPALRVARERLRIANPVFSSCADPRGRASLSRNPTL
uniref:Uncharacterized protein n=1 Tax=Athene cunicularia TaxID=194338 RepID=A0A663N7Q2_ATHCN